MCVCCALPDAVPTLPVCAMTPGPGIDLHRAPASARSVQASASFPLPGDAEAWKRRPCEHRVPRSGKRQALLSWLRHLAVAPTQAPSRTAEASPSSVGTTSESRARAGPVFPGGRRPTYGVAVAGPAMTRPSSRRGEDARARTARVVEEQAVSLGAEELVAVDLLVVGRRVPPDEHASCLEHGRDVTWPRATREGMASLPSRGARLSFFWGQSVQTTRRSSRRGPCTCCRRRTATYGGLRASLATCGERPQQRGARAPCHEIALAAREHRPRTSSRVPTLPTATTLSGTQGRGARGCPRRWGEVGAIRCREVQRAVVSRKPCTERLAFDLARVLELPPVESERAVGLMSAPRWPGRGPCRQDDRRRRSGRRRGSRPTNRPRQGPRRCEPEETEHPLYLLRRAPTLEERRGGRRAVELDPVEPAAPGRRRLSRMRLDDAGRRPRGESTPDGPPPPGARDLEEVDDLGKHLAGARGVAPRGEVGEAGDVASACPRCWRSRARRRAGPPSSIPTTSGCRSAGTHGKVRRRRSRARPLPEICKRDHRGETCGSQVPPPSYAGVVK